MTNELNKVELRRLAEAAMPGDWFKAGSLLCFDVKTGESHGLNVEDDRFIASASPAAVLSLLDECDEYESGMRAIARNLGAGGYNATELSAGELLRKVNWGIDAFSASQQNFIDSLRAERDAALAELEARRKDAEIRRKHDAN